MKPEKAIVILRMGEQARWRSGVTVEEEKEALDMAIESLKGRPHGEWICEGAMADYTNVLVYRCSICEEHFTGHEEDKKTWHFCPNCGASMSTKGGDAE